MEGAERPAGAGGPTRPFFGLSVATAARQQLARVLPTYQGCRVALRGLDQSCSGSGCSRDGLGGGAHPSPLRRGYQQSPWPVYAAALLQCEVVARGEVARKAPGWRLPRWRT